MERIGFRLALNPATINEYVEHHRQVWPQMCEALTRTGWHNYSLFIDRSDATLFGYFETPDVEAALSGMATEEVNERWQALMAPYFTELEGKRPDEGFITLENIFYLS